MARLPLLPPTHRCAATHTAVFRLQPPNNNKLSFSSAAANSAPATNDGKNEAACGLWTPASPPVRRKCRLGDQQRLTWPLAPRALFFAPHRVPATTNTTAVSAAKRGRTTVPNGFLPLHYLHGRL